MNQTSARGVYDIWVLQQTWCCPGHNHPGYTGRVLESYKLAPAVNMKTCAITNNYLCQQLSWLRRPRGVSITCRLRCSSCRVAACSCSEPPAALVHVSRISSRSAQCLWPARCAWYEHLNHESNECQRCIRNLGATADMVLPRAQPPWIHRQGAGILQPGPCSQYGNLRNDK
jgi:hypothetical protein